MGQGLFVFVVKQLIIRLGIVASSLVLYKTVALTDDRLCD